MKGKTIKALDYSHVPRIVYEQIVRMSEMREETDYQESIEQFKSNANVLIEPWGMSVDHIRLTIKGLPDTPYKNGKFIFEIKLPENYPFSPPYAYCHTLLWHPNIDPSIPPGKLNICLDLINPDLVGKVDQTTGASGWTPAKTLSSIIEALRAMIHMEAPFYNPNDPLNHEAGEQALRSPDRFNKQAREYTKKYAMD